MGKWRHPQRRGIVGLAKRLVILRRDNKKWRLRPDCVRELGRLCPFPAPPAALERRGPAANIDEAIAYLGARANWPSGILTHLSGGQAAAGLCGDGGCCQDKTEYVLLRRALEQYEHHHAAEMMPPAVAPRGGMEQGPRPWWSCCMTSTFASCLLRSLSWRCANGQLAARDRPDELIAK